MAAEIDRYIMALTAQKAPVAPESRSTHAIRDIRRDEARAITP
jgi:hypothetical protein